MNDIEMHDTVDPVELVTSEHISEFEPMYQNSLPNWKKPTPNEVSMQTIRTTSVNPIIDLHEG